MSTRRKDDKCFGEEGFLGPSQLTMGSKMNEVDSYATNQTKKKINRWFDILASCLSIPEKA